jgi:hypothetical protein
MNPDESRIVWRQVLLCESRSFAWMTAAKHAGDASEPDQHSSGDAEHSWFVRPEVWHVTTAPVIARFSQVLDQMSRCLCTFSNSKWLSR